MKLQCAVLFHRNTLPVIRITSSPLNSQSYSCLTRCAPSMDDNPRSDAAEAAGTARLTFMASTTVRRGIIQPRNNNVWILKLH